MGPARSCVRQGYFKDDFVHLFVRRPQRRSPLINRGRQRSLIALMLLSTLQHLHWLVAAAWTLVGSTTDDVLLPIFLVLLAS